ncbi:response regulator [Sulfurimonas sp.]
MQFKVLIADDEVAFRDILVSIVEMIFFKYYPALELQISVAGNGEEELTIAQKESQDVIITDINMPVMNGKEAVQKIRLFDKSVPILALTALTDSKDVEEIIQSGVSNYTAKPINRKLFIAQIKSFVNLFIKSGFSYNKNAINLISKQVFKRKMIFNIEWIEDIEESWEYFIEQNSMLNNAYIQNILQTVYNLELLMIKNNISNELILEENEQNYYITVSQIQQLENEKFLLFLSSNKVDMTLMKKDENFVTFLVSKNNKESTKEQTEAEENTEENPIELLKHELDEAKKLDLRYTVHEKVSAAELSQELDPSIEDKLENFEEDIDSLRLSLYDFEEAKKEDVRDALMLLVGLFDNFNKIVENIGLFNVIFRSFNSFVFFLKNLDDEILYDTQKRILLTTLIRGLVDDLEQWIVNVFIEHTTYDIHYLDASFAENCLEIEKIFLENEEDNTQETDDDDDSLEFF